ncbi:MAG: hypothetical protein ACTTJH_01785 [Bacteroidales bacterium]
MQKENTFCRIHCKNFGNVVFFCNFASEKKGEVEKINQRGFIPHDFLNIKELDRFSLLGA